MPSPPITYYQSLVTSEYAPAANFQTWLGISLGLLTDASNAVDTFAAGLDFMTCSGAQLDMAGAIIGQPRTVAFQPTNAVSPILDDTTYRILLRARIAQNQWDGTIDSLQVLWQWLFPGGSIAIIDGQNMSATIVVAGPFSSILQDLINTGYIVPRPQAVKYTYSFSQLPIFGFDQMSTYIAGFDTGKFA